MARRCCSLDTVVVVTRQPYFVASWMASAPQPVPISSKWSSGLSASFWQMRSSFARCASSSVETSLSKMALEYIMESSRNNLKKSFDRS